MVLSIIHFKTPSFTFSMGFNYNLTTGTDRPHQNTQKLANYMVGKGVKLKDVIFHIVNLLLLL